MKSGAAQICKCCTALYAVNASVKGSAPSFDDLLAILDIDATSGLLNTSA